tara:strand:+ start:4731 stop:6089 length:1359 start_codon:yes stop_codon:yes gene_type:complete
VPRGAEKIKKSAYNFFAETMLSIGDKILSTDFTKRLDQHRAYSFMAQSDLQELQLDKLAAVLDFASSKSPYYKNLKISSDSDPEAWLKRFPVLTKPILRKHSDALLTRPKNELLLYSTSGSSGIQTEVYVDKKEQANFRAILINWWEWTGFYLGKQLLQTGMTPQRGVIKKAKDVLTRTTYLNAFGLPEDEVLPYLRRMEGREACHLGGYASSLYVLAKIAKKHDLDVRFDAAIAWGDHMFDHYQTEIQTVFKTKVFENYGMNEGFMVGQKKDLDSFYLYTPNVYLEILDDNWQSVPDGEMGKVVLTKLDGFAMPLIRYYTGDLAIKLPLTEYPPERSLAFPLLKKVVGRDTDLVRTSSGKTLIVHFFTGIFEFYPEIRQFRVIQNELGSIEIEYIPTFEFSPETLDKIRKDMGKYLADEELLVSFRSVDSIPATKSGKPQIIQSNLDRETG